MEEIKTLNNNSQQPVRQTNKETVKQDTNTFLRNKLQ